MLIDAQYPDEIRVAVVKDGQIVDFDIESQDKLQLRGNIYLAKISGVEPSLQAAFVDYGGNRHGFLAFDDIHPDYFQIPQEDRDALLVEQAELAADIQSEKEPPGDSNAQSDASQASDAGDAGDSSGTDGQSEAKSDSGDHDKPLASESEADEAREADKRLRRNLSRRYRIQEVIKKRQVIVVQVVREERGNKGAALTTYLSLAGRYCVLMPNTSRGGGVSRRITRQTDRKRLKKIVDQLDLPSGMGLIVRTAGARCNSDDIARDHTYLSTLWSDIRRMVLDSNAPHLVHEEASLALRAVRDLYDPDISAIHVQGDDTKTAVEKHIGRLMPDDLEKLKPHTDAVPLFSASGLEKQVDNIFGSKVELASGGYLVINQTEALVTVDVNSGRATKERSIETTAYKTNLEAADAAARQMRLRDLAGLIVIDFIDMDDKRNIRNVEKAMKKALESDRARVQQGTISSFGLMELSRQRRRAGIASLTSVTCPSCVGTGQIRAPQSMVLKVIRALWARVTPKKRGDILIRVSQDTALHLLNRMRQTLSDFEQHCGNSVTVDIDTTLSADQMVIGRVIDGRFRELAEKTVSPDVLEHAASRRGARQRGRKPQRDQTSQNGRDGAGSPPLRAEGEKPARARRVPDIAIDGGEMLDAIACAPFLPARLSSQPPPQPFEPPPEVIETPEVIDTVDTGTQVQQTEEVSGSEEPNIHSIHDAMGSAATETRKPRQGWWKKRSTS